MVLVGSTPAMLVLMLSGAVGTLKFPMMESGQFVPLADESGMLACPQSLTTQEGLGHCIGLFEHNNILLQRPHGRNCTHVIALLVA